MTEPLIPRETALSSRGLVAQNLLIARNALDFTQHQLAEKSGVSRATIAQLEAGLGDPRLSTLESLAAALQIPTYFLVLDQATFRAVAELVKSHHKADEGAAATRDPIAPLLQAGGALNRLRAASIGVDLAREAGLLGDSYSVGAAIGAARLAATGMLLGARLAHLTQRFKPAPSGGVQKPVDDSEFDLGGGI